jgi:hypothetical protein
MVASKETYLEGFVVFLLAQKSRELTELIKLHLGEVDVELLADVQNLLDNPI